MNLNFEAPVQSLEQMAQVISLESSFVDNAVSRMKDFFPKLGEQLTNILSKLNISSYDNPSLEILKEYKVLSKRLSQNNFLEYQSVLVQIPEGFQGNFLDYVNSLNRVQNVIFKEAFELIAEYNLVLSSFITNKEDKTSLRVHTQVYTRADAKRQQILKELGVYFKEDDNLSKAELRKVISRFSDVSLVVDAVVELTKDNHVDNLKKIQRSVNECVSYIDKIVSNNEIQTISGYASKQLSECAMSVARYVELCAYFEYKVRQASQSVDLLVKTLDKVTK